MGKTVKKYLFTDTVNIGKYETYFKNMAAKGLCLSNIKRNFAIFEKRQGEKLNYRIDVSRNKPVGMKFDGFNKRGFTYAAGEEYFYVYSTPGDNEEKELFSSPEEESKAFSELESSYKGRATTDIVSIFFLIIFIFLINKRTPYLYAAAEESGMLISLVMLTSYSVFSDIKNYYYVMKNRKNLESGKWIGHKENWSKSFNINKIIYSFIMIYLIISFIIPIFDYSILRNYPLPKVKNDIPLVRLAEIEKNPDLVMEDTEGNDISGYNKIRFSTSILAPYQYEANETGKINDGYFPSLFTRYFKLTLPQMSEGLIKDLNTEYVFWSGISLKENNFKEVKYVPFDKVYTAKHETLKYIIVKYNNIVVFIKYDGEKEINDILPLIKDNI